MTEIEEFETDTEALGRTVEQTSKVTSAFNQQMRELGASADEASRDLGRMEAGFSRGLKSAIDGIVLDGDRLSDALRTVAVAMANTAYNAAMRPVTNHLGGLMSAGVEAMMGQVLPFANGAPFSQGRVMPFANGGVVSGPTHFPMRGATGLMGEAGPEAIMPLTRTADGRLGVAASGGARPVSVTMNISTPDVQGFRRSQGQIAAQMARVLGQGARNR